MIVVSKRLQKNASHVERHPYALSPMLYALSFLSMPPSLKKKKSRREKKEKTYIYHKVMPRRHQSCPRLIWSYHKSCKNKESPSDGGTTDQRDPGDGRHGGGTGLAIRNVTRARGRRRDDGGRGAGDIGDAAVARDGGDAGRGRVDVALGERDLLVVEVVDGVGAAQEGIAQQQVVAGPGDAKGAAALRRRAAAGAHAHARPGLEDELAEGDLDDGPAVAAELVLEHDVALLGQGAVHGGVAQAAVVGRAEGGHDLLGYRLGKVGQGGAGVEDDGRCVHGIVIEEGAVGVDCGDWG